jgi:hypothetical protein
VGPEFTLRVAEGQTSVQECAKCAPRPQHLISKWPCALSTVADPISQLGKWSLRGVTQAASGIARMIEVYFATASGTTLALSKSTHMAMASV